MGHIFNHRDIITIKEEMKMRYQVLNEIIYQINKHATVAELEEFKHLEQREDREAWVKNQIAKLDKGGVL